ncbi:MAG: hypothetical protein WBP94_13020 [Rhodomicrobiaceae bacterium]
MRVFGKVLMSAAALALAGGFSLAFAQAAPTAGKPAVSSQLQLAAATKKTAKTAKAKTGPGHCGKLKYWDKKTKKCADATQKKP